MKKSIVLVASIMMMCAQAQEVKEKQLLSHNAKLILASLETAAGILLIYLGRSQEIHQTEIVSFYTKPDPLKISLGAGLTVGGLWRLYNLGILKHIKEFQQLLKQKMNNKQEEKK